jgi:Ca2+-binding EF-hand superfamily protein
LKIRDHSRSGVAPKNRIVMATTTAKQSTENLPPTAAADSLSRMELEDLHEAFALFDTEKTGKVSVGELRSILTELVHEQSRHNNKSFTAVLKRLDDKPDDSTLQFDEFFQLLTTTESNQQDDLQRVFGLFDADGKGCITVDDLRRVAAELGEDSMEDSELQEMIDRASDKTGQVTIEQFMDMLNKKLFA